MKIVIAPLEISGIYYKLAIGLNELGVTTKFAKLFPDVYPELSSDIDFNLARSARKNVKKYQHSNSLIVRKIQQLFFLIKSIIIFIVCLFKFDTFIFAWGMSFLPLNIDLPILKLLRKNVIVNVGHGSEARAPYLSHQSFNASNNIDDNLYALFLKSRRLKVKLQWIEKFATELIGLPTTAQLLARNYVNFYALGLPSMPQVEKLPSVNDEILKVLHIPSKPEIKGSAEIRKVMAEVRDEFPHVSYLELTNMTNADVLNAMRNCDLIIDQLWSDIPMAMTGVEAASVGTASLTFGNATNEWRARDQDIDLPPPDGYISTDQFKTAVIHFISNRKAIAELCKLQKEFVCENWNYLTVSENYLKLLSGNYPETWLENPSKCTYWNGGGVSKEVTRIIISKLVKRYGVESLFITSTDLISEITQEI